MRGNRHLFLVAVLVAASNQAIGEETMKPLVPEPKEVRRHDRPAWTIAEGQCVIVIGDHATDAEKLAAVLLQKHVGRRFGQQWAILGENDLGDQAAVMVLLGQRATNAWLDRLCAERQVNLSSDSPGHDGYVIEMLEVEGKKLAIIGGSNARGVLYGQDTFFQLLAKSRDGIELALVSVRDWPTVPWRGRPQTNYRNYFRPGEWELYATSRINFIDLRDGIYAFEPGANLDKQELARAVREAHQFGIVVFGTVNCGVSRSQYAAALATFADFIELGVDGLWPSFDDKGWGDAPEEIIAQVLELARAHGIGGDRIAIAPPKGAYQDIPAPFNPLIAAVPGMEQAFWFFTEPPSPRALDQARAIGLEVKPSWWHNWTRPHSGFTHISSAGLLPGGRKSYMNVPPLSEGWHAPSYAELAEGGDCVHAIMPWGGNTWGQYYIVPVIGWWGWSPEGHDWNAVRGRIFDIVYGPGQIEAAMEFDQTLLAAEELFTYPLNGTEWQPACPARLRSPESRGRALRIFDQLDRLQQRIEKAAPAESLLPPEELKADYTDPMRTELETGRIEAALPYPEYWWDEHQPKLLTAIYDGKPEAAQQLILSVQERVLQDVQKIGQELGHLSITWGYADWWRGWAAVNPKGWQKLIARRREELRARVWDYGYFQAKTSTMLRDANSPPLGWGTGRWEKRNRVLATVIPTEREQFQGNWIGGVYDATPAAVFAHSRKLGSLAGNYSELEVEVPISGNRQRLGLMIFLSNHSKESIGLHYVEARWTDRHFIRLLWDQRVLWEADLGWPRLEGEWFVVKVPPVPDDVKVLRLRLRVEDRKPAESSTIAFVGPLRLIEIPE